ncbi:MAG: hypothetical protein HQK70_14445 [Desulfamplus sp.]|nr:hypothetical protein [Desulfamplus sp.]
MMFTKILPTVQNSQCQGTQKLMIFLQSILKKIWGLNNKNISRTALRRACLWLIVCAGRLRADSEFGVTDCSKICKHRFNRSWQKVGLLLFDKSSNYFGSPRFIIVSMSGFGINVMKLMQSAGWNSEKAKISHNDADKISWLAELILL